MYEYNVMLSSRTASGVVEGSSTQTFAHSLSILVWKINPHHLGDYSLSFPLHRCIYFWFILILDPHLPHHLHEVHHHQWGQSWDVFGVAAHFGPRSACVVHLLANSVLRVSLKAQLLHELQDMRLGAATYWSLESKQVPLVLKPKETNPWASPPDPLSSEVPPISAAGCGYFFGHGAASYPICETTHNLATCCAFVQWVAAQSLTFSFQDQYFQAGISLPE